MANSHNKIIEAEIVDNGKSNGHYYQSYTRYTRRPTDSSTVWVWLLGMVALFTSIIPFVGFVLAIIALIVSLIKKVPPVLPIIALVISSVITCFAWLIWAVITAIF